MQERRLALLSKVKLYRETQHVYMPQVAIYLAMHDQVIRPVEDSSDCVRVDIPPLCLPSGLPENLRLCLPHQHDLVEKEKRLRVAQCDDALFELRRHLRIRASALSKKKSSTRGQRESTRARVVLSEFASKINLIADRYREAFAALQVLDPNTSADWRSRFQPLKKEDVRAMHADSDDDDDDDDNVSTNRRKNRRKRKRKGDGYHKPSWIWMIRRTDCEGETKDELGTGMHFFLSMDHKLISLLS